jgi:hypothetical protein
VPKQFEPFLRGMKSSGVAAQTRSSESQASAPAALGATTALLTELLNGPRKLADLQQTTGLGFTEFADSVKALLDAKLIELEGVSGDETAKLSATGAALASQAR